MIGLYIAFILPVILRLRLGDKFEHGAWSLGKHYKWIDPIAIIWVDVHLRSSSSRRSPRPGSRGTTTSTGTSLNYAPLTVGGAFLLFGGWWVLSAKNWFKGPVRMGTEEELELLEEAGGASSTLPADTQYERTD